MLIVCAQWHTSLHIRRSWKECYQLEYLCVNKTFINLALWQCLVHVWLFSLWCVYLSIPPLSTYLCNVSIGLCVFQFSLTCPVALIDWLTPRYQDVKLFSCSRNSLSLWKSKLDHGTPSLEADQSISCPHNQYLFKIDFNITLSSYWLQKWFLPVIFLSGQNSVWSYCSVCMW